MRISTTLLCLVSLMTSLAVELTQPPSVEFASTNAIVHWTTDAATGTRAAIFPATAKVSVPDKTPASAHTVNLTSLKPGTTYTVTVGSARAWLATNTFTTTGSVAAPASFQTLVCVESSFILELLDDIKTFDKSRDRTSLIADHLANGLQR